MQTIQSMIQEIASECDMEFRDDYSGRGMYGKQCIAVVGSRSQFEEFQSELISFMMDEIHSTAIDAEGEEEMRASHDLLSTSQAFVRQLFNSREDNMGLDMVFYWPSVQAEEK